MSKDKCPMCGQREAQAGGVAVPAGYKLLEDGKTMIPNGWTWCRIEREPGYPEDVAFGPQRMMDRLKKWLDAHFAQRVAGRNLRDELGYEVRNVNGVWLLIDDCDNEREATLVERVLWDALLAATPAATPPAGAGMVLVSVELIRRAQQAINYHLEPDSPDAHERTMLELSAIGWPEPHAEVEAALQPAPAPAQPPRCKCGVKAASECDEEWGPQCDLGNNPAFARMAPAQPPAPSKPEQEPAVLSDAEIDARTDLRTDVERAVDAYNGWCNNQDIHCNRLPAWSELSPKSQAEWLKKSATVRAAMQKG